MAADVLAQVAISANTNTTVYTTAYTARVTIRIINRSDSQIRAFFALADTATPTDAEYIVYNTAIDPYGVIELSDLPVGTGHNMVARTTQPATVFVAGVPA